ncbi:MAG: helicase [Flavobacteriales bacterium CG_4_9_14_0_2_um_filter_35_242]|nr:DEAD/DEAH box helicase [Flavobacteriales bacterium]PIX07818.1 MAG: helicase [Flavobacteriales bacterium CG_4_8_14_3_um_filter_35_10]PJA05382.1 MAG: helicase [Flavobacteriales bacterium CG_4_10_14_0_2_um_filter_35_18]PJC59282.1 MAG: helicase [Flavobacteriales bacterium CG_4_9_14_0_2_um_filter_35_242]
MSAHFKTQKNILDKLGIKQLNMMQEEAQKAIENHSNIVLLSPTGTGKTFAFLLPIINKLELALSQVQVLILVPSRELAIQIEQVIRDMGAGFKANAVYGGRPFSKDKLELKHPPTILVGTPGRIADHLRKESFSIQNINTLVLDEFDKSLEIGFEEDMNEIVLALPKVSKRILTSATQSIEIPKFVGLENPFYINYLEEGIAQLKLKTVISPSKDKLKTLVNLLNHIGNEPGIIFCNFKDTIQIVSDFLTENKINHGCFFGGMEQIERERALIKFRNKTHQIIIATDLAARGLDIQELKFIIHYQLPHRVQEFTHRNGRTARMNHAGTAYVIKWERENLPDFIKDSKIEIIENKTMTEANDWQTLFISGGRKDKISKGDIAGLFIKQGHLEKDELGMIELKQDCAFVAVSSFKVNQLIGLLNNTKLKNKKVRINLV